MIGMGNINGNQNRSSGSNRISTGGRRRFTAKILALASMGVAGSAHAASNWTATSSGVWSNSANWNTLPVSGNTTVVDFSTAGTYTATDDNSGAFQLNQLNINNASGIVSIAAASPANYLWFNGSSPSINVSGTGSSIISAQLSGGAAFTDSTIGLLTIAGNNTYTSTTTFSAGTVLYNGSANSSGGGALNIATAAGNSAVVNFNSSGTVSFNTTNIGWTGTGSTGTAASVLQTSGTANLQNNGGYVEIGGAGGYGSYQLSGGVLNTTNSSGFRVGDGGGGYGVFTQTSGTLNVSRYFVIGGNQGTTTNNTGVATFAGGTFNTASAYNSIITGNASGAMGILNLGTQAGGNALITINDSIIGSSGATGVVNIDAGTLRIAAGGITGGDTTQTVNFNGGTLQASAGSLSLITASSTIPVYINNGGAVIDTQANNDTIAANLLAPAGKGIYPGGNNSAGSASVGVLNVASGGTGYIGTPIVTVSGGGGTGATAIADVVGGTITGVTLTNPGQNYAYGSTVTFNFNGGGPSSAAPAFTYTIGSTSDANVIANGTGGVTKIGTGTLTLTRK
jgi:fibronectin-binding autotransporter adhesin